MQHITTLSLTLRPSSDKDLSSGQIASLGPFFQGALLEKTNEEYVKWLHAQPFNPYSQYSCKDQSGNVVWRVNALNDEAAEYLIEPLRKGVDAIVLRSVPEQFEVIQSSMDVVSQKSLLSIVAEENPNKVKVRFATPTAFKSKGSYVIVPSPRLVFQNLLMHYSNVYEGDKEIDAETIEYIEQHVQIISYDLRSQYYSNIAKDGRKVPAFVGSMTLMINGPAAMLGLARMLLKFGEYSGVGIKTSMGMGGFVCL